jgi:hypothetical protein
MKRSKHRKMLREFCLKFVLGAETAHAGKIPEKILPTSTSQSPEITKIQLEKIRKEMWKLCFENETKRDRQTRWK